MSGIVRGLMGTGDDKGALQAQLAAQEKASRTQLATSINQEAEADQAASAGRRGRGRRLLTYLEGGQTLG